MRLAEFIKTRREQILVEWESFARTLGPASHTMDIKALRDHAGEMLTTFAADLETPQTPREQREKGIGKAPDEDGGDKTAASKHGAERAEQGFSLDEMASEYRALRASVIRLWTASRQGLEAEDVEDLTRFNEAIDQALAESIARYADDVAQSREMFLAILGHDLRTPLGAVVTASTFMMELDDLPEPHRALTSRIVSSAGRMQRMVNDLLDLTRSRLGGGIPIDREWMDMQAAVRDVITELAASHPERSIEVTASGVLRGRWDGMRISQVLTNLIANALEHGARENPVEVSLFGDGDQVVVRVRNHGIPIPATLQRRIFEPMKPGRVRNRRSGGGSSGLGLGLYIAERIVAAHSGSIEVQSSAYAGTEFTVRLPREA